MNSIPQNWVLYSCQVGSFAYNLNTNDSDQDEIVVFQPPLDQIITLIPVPDSFNLTNPDRQVYSLKKYFLLLSKSNPNVLETLYLPDNFIIYKASSMDLLFQQRDIFLSKQIYFSITGSAKSALKFIYNSKIKDNDASCYKKLMHAIRLLYTGIKLFSVNQYQVFFTGEIQKFLLDIRLGKYSISYLIEEINNLLDDLDYYYNNNKTLPEKTDIAKIDALYKSFYKL